MTYRIKNERGEYLSTDFERAEEAYAYLMEFLHGLGEDTPGMEQVAEWSLWENVGDKDGESLELLRAGVFSDQAGAWWLAHSEES